MELNCTINAFPPLINKYFWRKNGNYISIESMKYKIENKIINDYKIISKLTIKVSFSLSLSLSFWALLISLLFKFKYYDIYDDQGLYECTAENDLRVTKLVYNLNGKSNRHKENLI